jgi:hypothetical protein
VPAVDERMIPDATIVIVTHNRREEALRAGVSAKVPELPATTSARDRLSA